ncbi:MAG: hydrogenase nickel incorporation protein HypB [Gemmatimonadetes bacterium]|nr:hydrogenase nickel incorporation protein HypB [Gemmatimonadota bacterium]
MKTIQVIENVQRANDEVAAANRARLEDHGLAAVNLMGGPGSGKTTLLEATVAELGQDAVVGILTGDLATTRDAERLARLTPHVAQINTGRGCHLEAHQVRHGLDALELEALDLLFIENVGNLICPVSWDLGQERRVALFSMTDGDDKPAKHPYIVLAADLVLLNKIDLAPHVPFDRGRFLEDVRHLDEDVPVLELSALTGEGMEAWIEWLTRSATLAAPPAGAGP